MSKLLVVVDYQKDFVNGTLGFDGAQELDSRIAEKIREYNEADDNIVFLRDIHQKDTYADTLEGKHLPIHHCICGTDGAKYYGEVGKLVSEINMQPNVLRLQKETFGCKQLGTNVEALFGVPDEILVVGLVTDMCVIANAFILQAFFPNSPIHVDCLMVGSSNEDMAGKALDIMQNVFMTIDNRDTN